MENFIDGYHLQSRHRRALEPDQQVHRRGRESGFGRLDPLERARSHAREYALRDAPSVPDIENESIDDAVRILVLMRDELVSSASSRQSSGLVGFDSVRMMSAVQKLTNFLDHYVDTATPLDLPESSPIDPMPPAGRTGV